MIKNIFWILITFILSPIFYIRILWNKLFEGDEIKILLISTGKIGDLVCTTPVFRELKRKFPNSYLMVAIREQSFGVVQNNPHINEFVFLNSKKYQGFLGGLKLIQHLAEKKFSHSINLSPRAFNTILPFWVGIPERITSTSKFTGKTAQIFSFFNRHKLEYQQRASKLRHNLEILRFLNINDFSEKKEVFTTTEEEKKVNEFLDKNNLNKNDLLVGISVTAGNKLKEWEKIKFSQLADKIIKELGAKIIFIGAPYEKTSIEDVIRNMKHEAVLNASLGVNELAALLKKLKLFISVDTGPLYIAHAVNTPVVDILGPVAPEIQVPQDEIAEIVKKDIYCAPCCFIIPPARGCKEGHLRCIKEITVQDVFNGVKKLLDRL